MKQRSPVTVHLPVDFHAKKDHVAAVFHVGESSIGLRFDSVEMMLAFFEQMIETAAQVWPDNEFIKMYRE